MMRVPTVYSSLVESRAGIPDFEQPWDKTDIHFASAGGIYLYAEDGSPVMDFTAGLNGRNLGHHHPKIVRAVACEMEKYARSGGYFDNTEPIFQLKKSLSRNLQPGLDACFFTNTEADALKYTDWLAHLLTDRGVILRINILPVGLSGDSRARAYGCEPATVDEDKIPEIATYRLVYRYTPGMDSEPSPGAILSCLLTMFQELPCPAVTFAQVSGIILEMGGRQNGFLPPPVNFLMAVQDLCDQHGKLFILDEGKAAIGRTGRMFASRVSGVDPDLVVIGQGLANEYPLGCVAFRQGLVAGFLEGRWKSTGIDPMACAAALATLDVIDEENLLGNGLQLGERLLTGLRSLQQRFPMIGCVCGTGLNCALEIVSTDDPLMPGVSDAIALVDHALERGLLVYRAGIHGNVLCLLPPLNVTREQVDRALVILEQCLLSL